MGKNATRGIALSEFDAESQLHFASRLYAIDYFTCHILTTMISSERLDPAAIDDMHRRMLNGLGAGTATNVSKAHPEIALSELNHAVRGLISLQREMLKLPRRLRS
jgi:hypothetical protein